MRKFKKGASVYLVIMVGAVMLAIILGLVSLLIRRQVVIRQLSESVLALHGADSGIERILYAVRKESYDPATCTPTPCQAPYPAGGDPTLTNGVEYETYVQSTGTETKLRAIGLYRQIRRAIEITY
jgi:hypothetical protein